MPFWFVLAILQTMALAANLAFSEMEGWALQGGAENLSFIAIYVALNASFELFWGACWLAVFSHLLWPRLHGERAKIPTAEMINRIIIETLRSFAAILYRVPLLLFPAFAEYVRLAYVPYLVAIDPAYHRGEYDVLTRSRELGRGTLFALGLWQFFSWLMTYFALAGFEKTTSPWQISVVFFALLSLVVNTYVSLVWVFLTKRIIDR